MASSTNYRMGVIGKTYPKTCPPTVQRHSLQWRTVGVREELMRVLHSQVREQVKKAESLGWWQSLPQTFSREKLNGQG